MDVAKDFEKELGREFNKTLPKNSSDIGEYMSSLSNLQKSITNEDYDEFFDEISKEPSLAIKFSQVVKKKVESLIFVVVCKLEFLNFSFKFSSRRRVFLSFHLFSSMILPKFWKISFKSSQYKNLPPLALKFMVNLSSIGSFISGIYLPLSLDFSSCCELSDFEPKIFLKRLI